MPSTYSPLLRVELIGTGEQSGTWGVTTNTNLGTILEKSIAGTANVTITSANQALTASDGVDDQARCALINCIGTPGVNSNIYVPPSSKLYVVKNSIAGYTVTVYCSTILGNTTAAGTGITVPTGKYIYLYSDGTNIVNANNFFKLPTFVGALESATILANPSTGTIAFDLNTQSVLYYTSNATANWTINFRGDSTNSLNSIMAIGDIATCAFLSTQGSPAYYNNAVQVDSVSVTPKWIGATPPTSGNVNSIDLYSYTIIKTANSTFTVLATQTRFG